MSRITVTDAYLAAWLQLETGAPPRISRTAPGRARFTFEVSSDDEADALRTRYAASDAARCYAVFQNLLRVIR